MTLDMFPTAHLAGVRPHSRFASFAEQAAAAEAWETDPWAAAAILEAEILTEVVVDPCCGTGVLSEAARRKGYDVRAADLYDWGYTGAGALGEDFLTSEMVGRWCRDNSVLINPPFSLAVEFVQRALDCGARKVVCFQRAAWRESQGRRDFFDAHPPARVWVCGDRAHTWLLSVPPAERTSGGRQLAHAWYVWERYHRGAEITNAIYKDMLK